MHKNTNIIIICEGHSEVAYISEIRRLLRERNIAINLIPKKAINGFYDSIIKIYKKIRKENRGNTDIRIWVDYDIYSRNEKGCMTDYNKTKATIPFMFSYQNFEDFLALHVDDDSVLQNWINVCAKNNHFQSPMHFEQYEPLVRKHLFLNYKKGYLPFELTEAKIKHLFRRYCNPANSNTLSSDFTEFLKNEVLIYP